MSGSRDDPGITPRVVDAIFRSIEEAPDTTEFTIRVSYLEIYMERVRDLLNPLESTNLSIRQDAVRGIFVEGAAEEYVGSAEELLSIVRIGDANRAVATTGMNDISSRSHSVIQITLEVRDTVTRSLQVSKISLVDLAGSESVSRTGAEGLVLDEARTINKSLFNLAKVINSLAAMAEESATAQEKAEKAAQAQAQAALNNNGSSSASSVNGDAQTVSSGPNGGAGASASSNNSFATAAAAAGGKGTVTHHIPYRDSKLTRLLQDSLGGNARTALIVCCSPCSSNLTESLSTLRFGTRAKKIRENACES
jgi:Kinesin motor domain